MSSHRKPRNTGYQSFRLNRATRTAATLAAAAAASGTVFAEPGSAETQPTLDEVKTRVDGLFQQAEAATQRYDGARAHVVSLQRQAATLQDRAARTEAALETLRTSLGAVAAAQYRDGAYSPSLQLVLSADPQHFLEQAGALSRVSALEQHALDAYGQQARALYRQQSAAEATLHAVSAEQRQLAAAKAVVEQKLGQARQLLARLSAAQQAAVLHPAPTTSTNAPAPVDVPVSGRAASAVAFVQAQLGKPYSWGATGPGAYDCSGLIQAAWAAAGVALPRTTYDQINSGARVAVSALLPGDLVFYYPGATHVAIYVGGGRIIHAPHPGAPVEYAPVNEMPIVGAIRPA